MTAEQNTITIPYRFDGDIEDLISIVVTVENEETMTNDSQAYPSNKGDMTVTSKYIKFNIATF